MPVQGTTRQFPDTCGAPSTRCLASHRQFPDACGAPSTRCWLELKHFRIGFLRSFCALRLVLKLLGEKIRSCSASSSAAASSDLRAYCICRSDSNQYMSRHAYVRPVVMAEAHLRHVVFERFVSLPHAAERFSVWCREACCL